MWQVASRSLNFTVAMSALSSSVAALQDHFMRVPQECVCRGPSALHGQGESAWYYTPFTGRGMHASAG